MEQTDRTKSRDFNIYYLNFSKVYEIAMMINNVILTKIEKDHSSSFEEQYGFTSSISAQGTKDFLDGIKASISADAKETSTSSSKVVESLDVKTTKSILLRRVIDQCASVTTLDESTEGDLVKIDHVKLELLNEESLRQFLILRRDALKGMRVEGMEINNLVSSMLQDYAYIPAGQAGFIALPETKLNTVNGPGGSIAFKKLLYITASELKALEEGSVDAQSLYKKIGTDISDYGRKSVI